MDYEDIFAILAPCGLDCSTCLARAEGAISAHAKALSELLGPNFTTYAERFRHMEPVFERYAHFKEFLDFLSKGACPGCRAGGCLFKGCRVTRCVKEKNVDFCFQCREFPCSRTGFPPQLEAVWRRNNDIMRAQGVEAFFEACRGKHRYP